MPKRLDGVLGIRTPCAANWKTQSNSLSYMRISLIFLTASQSATISQFVFQSQTYIARSRLFPQPIQADDQKDREVRWYTLLVSNQISSLVVFDSSSHSIASIRRNGLALIPVHLFPYQCDQIGRFLNLLVKKILTKVAQIFWYIFGLF